MTSDLGHVDYEADAEFDTIVYSGDLRPGMIVLTAELAGRHWCEVSHPGHQLMTAAQNHWCTVTEPGIRVWPTGVAEFIGEYSDGKLRPRTVPPGFRWIVKKDSIPPTETLAREIETTKPYAMTVEALNLPPALTALLGGGTWVSTWETDHPDTETPDVALTAGEDQTNNSASHAHDQAQTPAQGRRTPSRSVRAGTPIGHPVPGARIGQGTVLDQADQRAQTGKTTVLLDSGALVHLRARDLPDPFQWFAPNP